MRGFTLIEMLLAVVIIGVVGTTVATATGGVANQMYALERRTIANWVAANELTRLRLAQRQELASRSQRVAKLIVCIWQIVSGWWSGRFQKPTPPCCIGSRWMFSSYRTGKRLARSSI